MGLMFGLLLAGGVFLWLVKRTKPRPVRVAEIRSHHSPAIELSSEPYQGDLDPGTPPVSARSALWLRNNSHRPSCGDDDVDDPFDDSAWSETSDDDDARYASFVSAMWKRPVADLGKLKGFRIGYTGKRYPVQLISLSKAEGGGYLYVNCYEAGEKKTYAADERHEWEVMGAKVDSSAFMGVALGVAPVVALGHRENPRTPEEARAAHNTVFKGSGRCLVIGYQDGSGQLSYRVVSKVVRQPQAGRFTANCHFRYGARRTFLFERLRSVEDADTGEPVDLTTFIRGGAAQKRKRTENE